MIRSGLASETEFFACSEEGLWVKSVWDQDRGVIQLCWQTRYRISEGYVYYIDENGDEFDHEHAMYAKYSENPWNPIDTVLIDSEEFIEFSKGATRATIEAVMRHQALLLALGFGDSVEDVAGWFKDLRTGAFIAHALYEIRDGVGKYHGCDGMQIEVEEFDPETRTLKGTLSVQGKESVELIHEGGDVVEEFLRSTIPIGGLEE